MSSDLERKSGMLRDVVCAGPRSGAAWGSCFQGQPPQSKGRPRVQLTDREVVDELRYQAFGSPCAFPSLFGIATYTEGHITQMKPTSVQMAGMKTTDPTRAGEAVEGQGPPSSRWECK